MLLNSVRLLEKCGSDDGMVIYKNFRGQASFKRTIIKKTWFDVEYVLVLSTQIFKILN